MQKYCKGVTLVELLVVLMIIGVMTMMGAPSFNGAIRSTRLATTVNEFVTSLSLARSEALKRNRRVVMIKTGTNWENGWQIFVDIDGNNTLNGLGNAAACAAGNDCILQVHEALPTNYTLRANGNFVNFIAYTSSGLSNNMGRFILCNSNSLNTAKLVLVNLLGRARISTLDADNDGIPEDDSGAEIGSCTAL